MITDPKATTDEASNISPFFNVGINLKCNTAAYTIRMINAQVSFDLIPNNVPKIH